MKELNFKLWLEFKKDIFGFDKNDENLPNKPKMKEEPIHRFDIELMMEELLSMKLEGKISFSPFVNEVHWGKHPGAMRVRLGTGLQVLMEQLNIDLKGEKTWILKKFYQINRDGYGGYEETVADEIFNQIKKIDENANLETPKGKYEELQNLVSSIATQFRKTARPIFFLEGIKKMDENRYLIHMGLTGQGVEAPDQRRVLKNITDVSFNPKTGKIRVINTNYESDVGKANEWAIMPSDTDFYFFPSQARDEIVEAVSVILRWY
jgi:hypothetical protein